MIPAAIAKSSPVWVKEGAAISRWFIANQSTQGYFWEATDSRSLYGRSLARLNFEPAEREFVEAGLDPMRWVKALDSVAFATGSRGALMMPITGGVLRNVPFTETISGAMDEYFRDGWHLRDERMRAIPIITKRGVADDFDGHSADAIAKHPFYQEFLAPHRLRWYAGCQGRLRR